MTSGPTILESGLAQIQRDLATMPIGVRRQLVAVADDTGIRFGYAARIGDSWTLSAELQQKWAKQRPGVRVTVVKTWT